MSRRRAARRHSPLLGGGSTPSDSPRTNGDAGSDKRGDSPRAGSGAGAGAGAGAGSQPAAASDSAGFGSGRGAGGSKQPVRGARLASFFTGKDPTLHNAVSLVRTVARNPCQRFEGTKKLRSLVTKARKTTCPPPNTTGSKRKRKGEARFASPTLFLNDGSEPSSSMLRPATKTRKINPARPHTDVPLDDYLRFVASNYYGVPETGCDEDNFQVFRRTTLGLLTSPLRRPQVIDKWAPYEIAKFESAICMYGKQFHLIQKVIRTKTVREVIEFYYVWKKGCTYKRWKETFKPAPI